MANYHWTAVPAKDEDVLIEKLNNATSSKILTKGRTHVSITDVPFYKNFKLAQATTYSTIPPVSMRFLIGGDFSDLTVVRMNGTNEPIFENNVNAGLVLNTDTVVPYVTFVMESVQSEEGCLRLVEAVDDDTFTQTPTPEERKKVTRLIRPAKVAETDDGFVVDAIMLYGDAVFRTEIAVKKDGYIDIVNDEKLAEGLPIRPIFLE